MNEMTSQQAWQLLAQAVAHDQVRCFNLREMQALQQALMVLKPAEEASGQRSGKGAAVPGVYDGTPHED